jgi:hypothetical protein
VKDSVITVKTAEHAILITQLAADLTASALPVGQGRFALLQDNQIMNGCQLLCPLKKFTYCPLSAENAP